MKRVWKKRKRFLAAAGALIFALMSIGLFGVFRKPAQAQFNPEQYGDVYGFLQTDSIGEISMNCNNDFDGDGVVEELESNCGQGGYGVTIDPSTLAIFGTGWSNAVGLVCFGASCGPDSPLEAPLGDTGPAQAGMTVDASGVGRVSGWARVRNLAQGSDGWISLKGENQEDAVFGVAIDFSSGTGGQWFGSGWNRHTDGTGFGWFDFSQVRTTFVPNIQCSTEGATQACGSGVGICQPGTQTCTNGFWGVCVGGVGPQSEVCSDSLDNDCDGSTNEGCGGCSTGQTSTCGAGACAGTQTCQQGSFWGVCEATGSPDLELCNGIDDNCNGLVDERPDCLFTVTPPQGVYEPLCCSNNDAPSAGQCPAGTQVIFCDGPNEGNKLTGTHLNTFEIKLAMDINVSGDAKCTILARKPGKCSVSAHLDCVETAECPAWETCVIDDGTATREMTQAIANNKAVLAYTVAKTDPIGEIPWMITECTMGSLTQTVGAPVFVHGNSWNELNQLGEDLYSALDCWYDVRHRYFNNAARCNLEGDYAFVRSMSRGVPVEGNCTDGVDNDGNGLADCADRWCKGIAYQCGATPVSGDSGGAAAGLPPQFSACTGTNVAADASYSFLNPPVKSIIACSDQMTASAYTWTICFDTTDQQSAGELQSSLQSKNADVSLLPAEQCATANGRQIWLTDGGSAVPESYVLKIENDDVYLQGATPAGRYHATQTFKQLVEQYGSNLQFPQIQVDDRPDFALRGVYDKSFVGSPADFDIGSMQARIDTMASLKMNTISLAAPMTMESDDVTTRAVMNASIADITQYARARFIEPMFWADYNPLYECKDCVEGITARIDRSFDSNGAIAAPDITDTLYAVPNASFETFVGGGFTDWETADACANSSIIQDGSGKSVKLSINGVCNNPPNNDSDTLSLGKAGWPMIKAGETAFVSVWTKGDAVGGAGVQLRFVKCKADSATFCDQDDPSGGKFSAQTIMIPAGTHEWTEWQVALPADGTDALLYILLRKQTNGTTSYSESVWVDDIRVYRFSDAMANVIRFPDDTNSSVRVSSGTTVYSLGTDYAITWMGDLKLQNPLDNARTFSVAKISGGALDSVDMITLSYDFFAPTQTNEDFSALHSLSEPKVISNFARDYSLDVNPQYNSLANLWSTASVQTPKAFIGMDELRGFNRDYRSTKRNVSNGALLAEEIGERQAAVNSVQPNAKVYVWDDMLNEYHNGGNSLYEDTYGGKVGKTSEATGSLPPQVVPIVWNYNSSDWQYKIRRGLDWLKEQDIAGQGINDCVLGNGNTTDSAQMMSFFGYGKCSGLMAHPWPNTTDMTEGIASTARYGWAHYPQEETSWGLVPF
ncbi:MAG: glycoside hydrolase family 20 zincin-like fold domain-containing protein [Patescibacteria group bacterium]